MDRVPADKDRDLQVPAYESLASVSGMQKEELNYIERFKFYETAGNAFCVVQTDDKTLYANCILSKGVL